MNLFAVTADCTAGDAILEGSGVRLLCDEVLAAIVDANGGHAAELTIGIRPQHLRVTDASEHDLAVDVDVVEPLGAETFLYGTLVDGQGNAPRDKATEERRLSSTVVRVEPGTHVVAGDRVYLRIEPGHTHIFDTSGTRLSASN